MELELVTVPAPVVEEAKRAGDLPGHQASAGPEPMTTVLDSVEASVLQLMSSYGIELWLPSFFLFLFW